MKSKRYSRIKADPRSNEKTIAIGDGGRGRGKDDTPYSPASFDFGSVVCAADLLLYETRTKTKNRLQRRLKGK